MSYTTARPSAAGDFMSRWPNSLSKIFVAFNLKNVHNRRYGAIDEGAR